MSLNIVKDPEWDLYYGIHELASCSQRIKIERSDLLDLLGLKIELFDNKLSLEFLAGNKVKLIDNIEANIEEECNLNFRDYHQQGKIEDGQILNLFWVRSTGLDNNGISRLYQMNYNKRFGYFGLKVYNSCCRSGEDSERALPMFPKYANYMIDVS